MKIQSQLRRLAAMALSIVMTLTLSPITVFAEDNLTQQIVTIASFLNAQWLFSLFMLSISSFPKYEFHYALNCWINRTEAIFNANIMYL